MKICEIHEILPEYLEVDLSDFDILTFDDGLYTQYIYHEHFMQFGKPMYFFISPGIVCYDEYLQTSRPIHCADAHNEFFTNKTTWPYMTWKQIRELSRKCIVGGHSFDHPDLSNLKPVQQITKAIDQCEKMLKMFEKYRIKIHSFCYPYNDIIPGYKGYLEQHGVHEFFGPDRIPIESIITN